MGRRFWQIRMRCKKNRSSNIMRIGLCVYLFALTVTLIFHDLVADSICSECILSAFSLSFDEWCKIHKFKFLTFGKLFHQNIFLNAFEFFLLLSNVRDIDLIMGCAEKFRFLYCKSNVILAAKSRYIMSRCLMNNFSHFIKLSRWMMMMAQTKRPEVDGVWPSNERRDIVHMNIWT